MAGQEVKPTQLVRLGERLSGWREQHGGRGQPIPEELWAAAVQVAQTSGVDTTARALRIDRARLSRRVERSHAGSVAVPERTRTALASNAFVEVDARGVLARSHVLVRLTGRDGERLELELADGLSAVDVAALAQAFWNRSRCCS